MLSKHPLELVRDRAPTKEELVEAIRLSIIAELDAINLYLQLARAIEDESIRRVLEDVAREEKTHVGEFLALLTRLDPQQAEELKSGEREVRELLEGRESP
uniref:Rubrerythrin n=1 Tax=Fervidicoccus fontis TaxID=683846 RepID=A0A7J3ZLP2_9CREN